jgi:hypothetical protein
LTIEFTRTHQNIPDRRAFYVVLSAFCNLSLTGLG